ncbi:MBL fold metallo-hydrolase [Candidatus Micrarchaeota archaeon]|nr:MBL fold metallo-hydrolase [Candidatus Micrarchaeota archaeon]MBU1165334.1 MBL fold metallo-hydrolase [Candidatus Micrarchaeota archaeon]MBU1886984.1 MBL fold metallo-hydrolase [Candidatus Micrarchaeota archaeon]
MEIVFLGTGGGRINLLKQIRGTGGFRINSTSANIHIDPGPGALVHSVKLRQSLLDIDAVIVTHGHLDHYSDAMVLIEGMSAYGLKKRGIFICNKNSIDYVSPWHKSKIGELYLVVNGEKKTFKTEKGSFEIETMAMKHDEESAFGFKLFMDEKVIGHITDTEYFDGLEKGFEGCDLLIVNCIKPEPDKYKGHLETADVIKILKKAKPKKCVITHMGIKMLRAGPLKQAERIKNETGIETVAAKDGMRIIC